MEKNEHSVIEVNNLSVKFGNFYAVKGINFQVKKGDIFGFLGANGAGKTTTIRVLCGTVEPTSGEIRVLSLDSKPKIKRVIGYMSQKFSLYSELSVKENIEFAGTIHSIDKLTVQKKMKELLEFVGFNYSYDTLVKNLPGGTRQYVSLVAALIHDPSIILLDEPTAGVGASSKAHFWSLIHKLSSEGKTLIVTTHYMDEAEYCNKLSIMDNGLIVAMGSPEELKAKLGNVFEIIPKKPYEENLKNLKVNKVYPLIQKGEKFRICTVKNIEDYSDFIETKNDSKATLEDVFIYSLGKFK